MRKLLVPGDEVIFDLIDLFSELNEKRTEFMRVNINEFFGDSFIANIRRAYSHSPQLSPSNNRGEYFSRNFTENCENQFVPRLKGTQIINFLPPLYYFARTNTCPLLKKIAITIDLILAYCPVSSPLFFSLLTDQLSVLERFVTSTSSRVVVCEMVEKILQTLINLKSVFIRLNDYDAANGAMVTGKMNMSHRVSPRNQIRQSKSRTGSQLRREDSFTMTQPGAPIK